uniref:Uncharacterized protein n=1 Tax=Anguilla anguilla TaxID=7936 RepID=A0A0E9PXH3_ANGAN
MGTFSKDSIRLSFLFSKQHSLFPNTLPKLPQITEAWKIPPI